MIVLILISLYIAYGGLLDLQDGESLKAWPKFILSSLILLIVAYIQN